LKHKQPVGVSQETTSSFKVRHKTNIFGGSVFRDEVHVQPAFFAGYEKVERGGDVFIIAGPEKALLDKMYIAMRIGKFSTDWLKGLRLQNLNILDEAKLKGLAALVSKPGFAAAVDAAAAYIRENREG
jgi:hypothetical protein